MKQQTVLFSGLFVFLFFMSFADLYSQSDKRQLIKKQTVFQYDVSSGSVGGSGNILTMTETNRAGFITKQITYKKDGNVLTEISKIYDKENLLLEVITEIPESGVTKSLKHSYANNRIVQSVSYTQGSPKVIVDQVYDDNGNLTEIISRTPNSNEVVFRTEHEYNSEGRLTAVRPFSLNNNPIGEMRYKYGEDGLVETESFMNGKRTKRSVKKMDGAGNIREELIYDSQGRLISKVTNRFNDKGLLIEDINEMPFADMKIRNTHRYDENDIMIETVNYNKFDEPVKLMRMEYEFYEEE